MSKRTRLNINKDSDHEKIKKNLENWVHIYDRHYHLIPVFSRVRYINRETGDFYYGGIIIQNNPGKIVIRGIGFDGTWSINPTNHTVFIEDYKFRKNIVKERNNLYQLYCDGKLHFSFKED